LKALPVLLKVMANHEKREEAMRLTPILYPTMCLVLLPLLSSCASKTAVAIDNAISDFRTQAERVKLGDHKEKVLSILLPTQNGLPVRAAKSHESFMEGNSITEIYFFRSGRQPDGLTTDDEFTPYVFKDGVLKAIGWTTLGGAKTVGQVVPKPPTTNVTVQPPPPRSITCVQTGNVTTCH